MELDLTLYDERLHNAATVAHSKEGKLVNTEWEGGRFRYEFKCIKEHTWPARLDQIIGTENKPGSWCKTMIIKSLKLKM
ncbi:MAG: hypothetical protein Barrevirus16_5 [Barrevirus sp.]|uniref:Uncharacterized protein n=1 Tax=Barrevirus sp. TaxID=2487763 RepID=A0A3G4ZQK8_9VIRU|nr:MAG: hypothetical protein Barrevirus16_5 [Barrevirus sp.]